jgi:TPR repeat protein
MRFAIVLTLVLFLAAPAWADFEEGSAAFERGDYVTAFREFKTLAEEGDADSQVVIGFMYAHGLWVLKDAAEAAEWYRKAAQDYLQAHLWLSLAVTALPPGKRRNDALIVRRDLVERYLSPEEFSEAERLVRMWKPTVP